jgi:hypothetical protein
VGVYGAASTARIEQYELAGGFFSAYGNDPISKLSVGKRPPLTQVSDDRWYVLAAEISYSLHQLQVTLQSVSNLQPPGLKLKHDDGQVVRQRASDEATGEMILSCYPYMLIVETAPFEKESELTAAGFTALSGQWAIARWTREPRSPAKPKRPRPRRRQKGCLQQ